jgi:hypothetical protein
MPTAEYMKEYRQRRLDEAVERLGGRCVVCGTTDGLEFDHVDPATKVREIASIWQNAARFWAEVSKCQLLCRMHHLEKTNAERKSTLKHGTPSCYRQLKCRCEPCRLAQSAYKKAWRASRASGRIRTDDPGH